MMPARPGFRHCAATNFGRVFFLALSSTPVHAQQRFLLEETTAASGKAAPSKQPRKITAPLFCAVVRHSASSSVPRHCRPAVSSSRCFASAGRPKAEDDHKLFQTVQRLRAAGKSNPPDSG